MLTPSKVILNFNEIFVHIWVILSDVAQNFDLDLCLFCILLSVPDQLDCHFLIILMVDASKDLSERSLAE